MTVIAWDGKTLAADKMMSFGTTNHVKVTKIIKIDGMLVGTSGSAALGNELKNWVAKGRKIEEFPTDQRDSEKCCSLLIIEPSGTILLYNNGPYPTTIHDKFFAIGSGDEFALAVMFLGRSAREAVNVAIQLCQSCGLGIDELTLD